jgi:hypothetical protein
VQTRWAEREEREVLRRGPEALCQARTKKRCGMGADAVATPEQRVGPPMTVKEMNRGDRVSRPPRCYGPAHPC